MALNSTILGTALYNYIIHPEAPADVKQEILERWIDIADIILNHIKTYGQISTTVTVASVSGVTTGPGVSGPGSGSGTGTIA